MHLLGTKELGLEEIRPILSAARCFSKPLQTSESVPQFLKGMTIVNLFFENSTRTRTSFELATRKLGGSSLNFQSSTSSVNKGETLVDTVRNIEAMKPHCIVVRHPSAGSPAFLADHVKIPIINAGDGFHDNPTQDLLDVYTIQERLGDIAGKRVVIVGDIAHSRVARSNIYLMKKLGASVAVCGPPTLLPPHPEHLGVDHAYRLETLLPDADVIMPLRLQLERQNGIQFPNLAEYSRFWGLNSERAENLKPGAIVLHPGPINHGVEIDPEVAMGPRSVILDQVFNGILVRMAVLSLACARSACQKWLAENE